MNSFSTTKYYRVFFTALLIFGGTAVLASPPAPSQVCNILGTIKSVELKEAYDEPCLKEPGGCPTDFATSHPAQYIFNIKIEASSQIDDSMELDACGDIYPQNSEQTIYINKDKVNPGDVFNIDQKIIGTVKSMGKNYFDSYILEGVILPQTERPTSTDEEPEATKMTPTFYLLGALALVVLTVYLFYKRSKQNLPI